jgi:transposase
VMAHIRVPRPGPGRPRTRPLTGLADRAYSSRAIRSHLRRRSIRAVIPQPSDQVGHRLRRGRLGGRPPGFDSEAYKQRNTVERCINRLKQWRGPGHTNRQTRHRLPGRTPPRQHPHLDPTMTKETEPRVRINPTRRSSPLVSQADAAVPRRPGRR